MMSYEIGLVRFCLLFGNENQFELSALRNDGHVFASNHLLFASKEIYIVPFYELKPRIDLTF